MQFHFALICRFMIVGMSDFPGTLNMRSMGGRVEKGVKLVLLGVT